MPNLVFLALFENKIKTIEDELTENTKLQFLDISSNQLESCSLDKLPKSLIVFNVGNNPFTPAEDEVRQFLPNLVQFNDNNCVDTQFVSEETLPFSSTSLTRERPSSQSGMLRMSISESLPEPEEQVIAANRVSYEDLARVNAEIVENYKKALVEEMDRIKKEFQEKKEKLVQESQERKKSLLNSEESPRIAQE